MKKIKLIIIFGLGLLLLFSFYRTRPWTASAQTIPGGFPVVADFNGDGYVNLIDFEIWRQNRYPAAPTATGQPTATPTVPGQPTDTPTTPATASFYKVFVTSQTYNGNLGGLSGGDSKCQSLATAAGLSGSFKAWLSDSTTDAKDRINPSISRPYYLVDGVTKIANDLSDLTDGSLNNNIGKYENNNPVSSNAYTVFTGTMLNGTKSNYTCNNWLANVNTIYGMAGAATTQVGTWTQSHNEMCSASNNRLYCFQTN